MNYKRLKISKFGGSDALRIVEENTLPQPSPGEALAAFIPCVARGRKTGLLRFL